MPGQNEFALVVRLYSDHASWQAGTRDVERYGHAAERARRQVQGVGDSVHSAGRQAFRYTYYAMAALRLGQALIARSLLRNILQPAQQANTALYRVMALSREAADSYRMIDQAAAQAALSTPFLYHETTKGIEELIRGGRAVREATEEIGSVARLATISGRAIETEASFMSAIMTAYSHVAIDAQKNTLSASIAVDQMTRAMQMSRYAIGDLQSALENAMDTAAGFNQTFGDTLALISALAMGGATPAQAGTMVRQLMVRIGDPKVRNFYGTAMGYWEENLLPDVLSRRGADLTGRETPEMLRDIAREVGFDVPQLVTEAGEFGNIAGVVTASAEVLEHLVQQAREEGFGAEAAMARAQILYETFGIRQIRPFLALMNVEYGEKRGLEAMYELQESLRGATGASEEYIETLLEGWEMTKAVSDATSYAIKQRLGRPLVEMMVPMVRMWTEIRQGILKVGEGMPVLMETISVIVGLGGVLTLVGGSIGLAAGMWGLFAARLADVGREAVATGEAMRAFTRLGRAAQFEAGTMTHAQIGRTVLLHKIIGPLKLVGALLTVITAAFVAWRLNLGGLNDRLQGLTGRLTQVNPKIDEWGEGIKNAIEGVFAAPAWQAFWKAGFSRERRMVHDPLAIGGMAEGRFEGAFWRVLDKGFNAAVTVLTAAAQGIGWVLGMLWKALNAVFFGMAWVVGLGNVERGFRRLGDVVGFIAGVNVMGFLLKSTLRVARAMWTLTVYLHGGIGKMFHMMTAFLRLTWLTNLLTAAIRTYYKVKIFVTRVVHALTNAYKLMKSGMLWAHTKEKLAIWAKIKAKWAEMKTDAWAAATKAKAAGSTGALSKSALSASGSLGLFTKAVGTATGALTGMQFVGGRAAYTMAGGAAAGKMAAGGASGGMLGGLGGAAMSGLLLKFGALVLVAIGGALIFQLFRMLFSRRPEPGPVSPTRYYSPPMHGEMGGTSVNVNVSPTLVLPQGTPEEHAKEVIEIVNREIKKREWEIAWRGAEAAAVEGLRGV